LVNLVDGLFMARILFLGDLLLAGDFLEKPGADPDYTPFADPLLQALIREHDLVIASLDCSLSGGSEPIAGDRIILETKTSALRLMKNLKISVLTLATNHAFDFGIGGFAATRNELLHYNVLTAGAGGNLSEAASPLIVGLGNTNPAFIALADAATSAVTATSHSQGVNPLEPLEMGRGPIYRNCARKIVW
jgi:poly-gamma-glutamate capsule biosynthesis protein CapA/YwtB (metallophosphatase superfamily)